MNEVTNQRLIHIETVAIEHVGRPPSADGDLAETPHRHRAYPAPSRPDAWFNTNGMKW